MKLKINPFDTGNPMSFKDAAKVATVVALVIWILNFFSAAQWNIIIADVGAWCFEAFRTYVVAWAGTFGALAGLEELIKRGETE